MGLISKKKKENSPENAENSIPVSDTAFPFIKGIDTEKGIAMTGGTADGYRQVLSMFRRDSEDRIQKLRFFLFEGMSAGKFPEKHLSSFITQIYALKSALATIGAAEISIEAASLETAGKDKDLALLQNNLPDFIEHLVELGKSIRAVTEPKSEESTVKSGGFLKQVFARQKADKPPPAPDNSGLVPLFNELKDALKAHNVKNIDNILERLKQNQLDQKTRETLEYISDQVLVTEFESAIITIDELIAGNR